MRIRSILVARIPCRVYIITCRPSYNFPQSVPRDVVHQAGCKKDIIRHKSAIPVLVSKQGSIALQGVQLAVFLAFGLIAPECVRRVEHEAVEHFKLGSRRHCGNIGVRRKTVDSDRICRWGINGSARSSAGRWRCHCGRKQLYNVLSPYAGCEISAEFRIKQSSVSCIASL